jgi:tetratricopeptide (TPR) repeat protein
MPVPEGIRRCEELRQLARGHRALEASILGPLGSFYAQRGDFGRARQLYAKSKATFIDLGLKFRAALGTVFGGRIEQLANNPVAAEQELRWGYEAFEAMGETNIFSTIAGHLGAAVYDQERYEEVERIATAAKEATAPNDVLSEVLWRGPYAKVLARRGASQQAEELAGEAVGLARGTDALNTLAGALMDLAEVQRITARPDEAISHVEEARHLYELKGNIVSAAKTRALLDELASAAAAR